MIKKELVKLEKNSRKWQAAAGSGRQWQAVARGDKQRPIEPGSCRKWQKQAVVAGSGKDRPW